jgi:hypothetical protein
LDDSRYLVIKKSYTLKPERLTALFDTFSDSGRYPKFGLHISLKVKGWGRLSNVGLAMKDHSIDGNMEQCRFTQKMPTTMNTSVWALMMSVRRSFGGEEELELVDDVFGAVLSETKGLARGASKTIRGQPGSLEEKLYDILQGKDLRFGSGKVTVTVCPQPTAEKL